jgi:serine/threonine protein kinase
VSAEPVAAVSYFTEVDNGVVIIRLEASMRAGLKLSGRYALQALLGSGGMGEVWRGVDEQLDRPVAIKVLQEHLVDPELAGRFRREARISARLQHPGITVVHDVGSDNGHLFIVMELLHGRDLAAMLAEAPGGLPIDAVVSLTLQAAEALQAAHAGHVVHRDLKPANLFVLDGGLLKICDFGIAWTVDSTTRLTATGQAIGTPAYMSPEQCQGQQVDKRSDLYSLGCVLYALLTGQPPFAEGQPLAIMLQHLNAVPASPRTIRPVIPAALDRLVLELLAKDPALRPANLGYIVAALRPLCYTPTIKVEPSRRTDQNPDRQPDGPRAKSIRVPTGGATATSPLEVSGSNSKVLEIELKSGRYLLSWSVEGSGFLFRVRDESEEGGKGTRLVSAATSHARSGEEVVRLAESGRHLLSIKGDQLDWKFSFRPV